MDRADAQKVLEMFKIAYPQSYTHFDKSTVTMFINLWTDAFKNIPNSIVFKAVKSIIYTNTREFAPNIGQVMNQILNELAPDTEERAMRAWENLRSFISKTSSWATKDEEMPMYNKLDAITKQMYPYREAKRLGTMTTDSLEYRRNEFLRVYKQLTYKRNARLLEEGNLIELADGKERMLALGYAEEEITQIATNQQKLIGESRVYEFTK